MFRLIMNSVVVMIVAIIVLIDSNVQRNENSINIYVILVHMYRIDFTLFL